MKRFQALGSSLPTVELRLFSALRDSLKGGYRAADFRTDALAGIVVGMVAIPLGMALAIASGVRPENGLYTVILGGFLVALMGGSRCQVTGPTAAFVVILVPIVQKFGYGALLLSGLLAGVMLILMGLFRFGRLIQFIPHPVTTGFTAGIGVVIGMIQLKDFFGLQLSGNPESFLQRVAAMWNARGTFLPAELSVAAVTLFFLVLWPRLSKKIPAPIVILPLATVAVILAERFVPGLSLATIGRQFSGGIPGRLPEFHAPWNLLGEAGSGGLLTAVRTLLPSAFAIALLGAIESLLSAVVADGMAQTRHDPDAELVALGIANVACPFFGGIAATGAIARTATNIRYGARSPIASIVHALFVLLVVLFFAPYVSLVPMASLAALLVLVAYKMSDFRHFVNIVRVAPLSDVFVLLTCFGLTVIFDMVIGVGIGVVLAALLFMRRMAELTSGQPLVGPGTQKTAVPKEFFVYEIAGPLFFGAAETAIQALGAIQAEARVVIFLMEEVPSMDVTGLVALSSAVRRLVASGRSVVLAGVQSQPRELIERSELAVGVRFASTLAEAVAGEKPTQGKL